MQNLQILLKIANEKNVSKKEIEIALAALVSSATQQAMDICKIDSNSVSVELLDNFQQNILSTKSEKDIEKANQEFNTLISPDEISFFETFQTIFEKRLEVFIKKIEKL